MNKQEAYLALLAEFKETLSSLAWDGSRRLVPGEGNLEAKVVFVGEAPGRVEDELRRPFVGPAGKLLEEILAELGLARQEIYITNIVKFRPPENRDPTSEEIAVFRPSLLKELSLINPLLVVVLGRHALVALLPDLKLAEVKGQVIRRGGRLYYVTYHPAAALHNPHLKSSLIADLQKLPVLLRKIESGELTSQTTSSEAQQNSLF